MRNFKIDVAVVGDPEYRLISIPDIVQICVWNFFQNDNFVKNGLWSIISCNLFISNDCFDIIYVLHLVMTYHWPHRYIMIYILNMVRMYHWPHRYIMIDILHLVLTYHWPHRYIMIDILHLVLTYPWPHYASWSDVKCRSFQTKHLIGKLTHIEK